MAVVSCPSCNKKISDKAKSCSYCQVDLTNIDPEKLASIRRINTINKSQKIQVHAFIAMLLFCGGFLYYYWQNVQPDSIEYYCSVAAIVIGFFLYIITRVQLILLKRNLK